MNQIDPKSSRKHQKYEQKNSIYFQLTPNPIPINADRPLSS